MIPVKLGRKLPLFVAMANESSNYVVRADVVAFNPYTVLHNDIALDFIVGSPGYYANDDITMPDKQHVQAVYSVYANDGTTLLAKSDVTFYPDPGSRQDDDYLVGVVIEDSIIGQIVLS